MAIKVLSIASWYPNQMAPKNGNFVEKHIRSTTHSVDQTVLFVQKDETKGIFEIEITYDEQASIKSYGIFYGSTKIAGILDRFTIRYWAYYKGLKAIFKDQKEFNIVHVHISIDAGLIAFFLKRLKKLPYVITEHSTVYQKKAQNKYRFDYHLISKISGNNADLIMPVSKDLQNRLLDHGIQSTYQVVSNVVNTNLFIPKLKGHKIKKEQTRFLHISSFKKLEKNVEGILRVAKKLSEITLEFKLTIAGDGDLNRLIEYANKLKIPTKTLHFHGPMTEVEVARIMQDHDIFVLFSNFENLPCVLLEAQACGLPIIATEIAGIPEIIDNENFGILIPPKDEQALLEAMKYMMFHLKNYNPQQIRKRALEKYDEKIIGRQIVNIYHQVLAQSNAK